MNERDELLRLAVELRAQAEWQLATGATGSLPAERRSLRIAPTSSDARRAPASAPSPRNQSSPGGALAAESSARPTAPASDAASTPVATEAALSTAALPLSPEREAAKLRLLELAAEVKTCTKCTLYAARTQTVFARGNPAAELCFIGEGPGADEDAAGFPFVGKAGQLLDRMIAAMGYARDDVYVCNIVKCRPPNNRKPEPDEMGKCMPYLREQLELVSPKVIVALGATAVEGLLGAGGGITRLRGQWKLYRAIPVMPTFHPAYLLRSPEAKRDVWADLQAVLKHLGRSPPPVGRSA
ncbi:MAG TPA: uracil-DNA glycosylase family protein [Polyangiaceae bacterium]|nr:uracil-DNA glycosylase family protein [Polyangiaceae bacterium]